MTTYLDLVLSALTVAVLYWDINKIRKLEAKKLEITKDRDQYKSELIDARMDRDRYHLLYMNTQAKAE